MSQDDKTIFVELAEGLRTQGFFAQENFLSSSEVSELRMDALQRLNAGEYHRAGIGQSTEKKQIADSVRRDEICWFDENALSKPQELLFQRLMKLKDQLNQELLLGLWDFELHYANYETGGFYRRHLDRFHNDSARTVSLVIYLNEAWSPEDGGQLLLYQNPGDKTPALEVNPLGGTVACFLSSEIEHEVQVSNKKRMSIAAWFRTRK